MEFTALNVQQEALQEDQYTPCYPQLIALMPAEHLFRYVEQNLGNANNNF